MKRQSLDDGTWFDIDKATVFEEDTYWNGNNNISKATCSQWSHETLYKTKKGKWVLYHSSQYQDSRPSWEEISEEEAAKWLVVNEHELDNPSLNEHIDSLEI
jgi:hypothetical protein